MTPPSDRGPLGPTPGELPEEAALRRLLESTLAEIEPGDRLDSIRSRTQVTTVSTLSSSRRPWIWGALGAAVATAAVIGGFALLDLDPGGDSDPGPVASPSDTTSDATGDPTGGATADDPSASSEPSTGATDDPTASGSATSGATVAIPVYYAGDTPSGVRLYREFQRAEAADAAEALLAAARAATEGAPRDPDYRSLWPGGRVVESVTTDRVPGQFGIVLSADAPLERPAGMSREEAQLAIEQVIYTVQGVIAARSPVQFYVGDNPVATVLGVPTSEPLAQGIVVEVLSLMNVTAPEEGATVSGSFEASGVTNSFEATLDWEIRDGQSVVASGFATAEGANEPRLFPWNQRIDLAGVPPGTYIFEARTSDPSGGEEGFGPHVDTKTITVE